MKIDALIKKFKEIKDSLSKNTLGTVATAGGTTTINGQIGNPFGKEEIKFEKNGQWKLDKVDPQENVNIPHPQKPPKMAQDPKHDCKKCNDGPCTCRK